MGKLRITPEVARAIVDAGTGKRYKSTQIIRKPTPFERVEPEPETEPEPEPEVVYTLNTTQTEVYDVVESGKAEAFYAFPSNPGAVKQTVSGRPTLELVDNAGGGGIPVCVGITCEKGIVAPIIKYLKFTAPDQTVQIPDFSAITRFRAIPAITTSKTKVIKNVTLVKKEVVANDDL